MSARPELAGVVVANAPISYGSFELTVGIDPNTPDGVHILDEVSVAGYAGIDLGPVGYLGVGEELGQRLAARNLGLAGAYLEMPYSEPAALEKMVPELDAMLDTFDAIAPYVSGLKPRPTLADAGCDDRRAHPGQWRRAGSGYTDDQWRAFARGLSEMVNRCRDRGYEPTFHHETGTYIEGADEIEKMLELTDVNLCLDTGHFLLSGGDPVKALRDWQGRINHVHIKDAIYAVLQGIIDDGAPTPEIWVRECFPAIGQGDLDADGVIDTLAAQGYSGWLIVEQDIMPQTAERFARAAADQRANRAFLADRGL